MWKQLALMALTAARNDARVAEALKAGGVDASYLTAVVNGKENLSDKAASFLRNLGFGRAAEFVADVGSSKEHEQQRDNLRNAMFTIYDNADDGDPAEVAEDYGLNAAVPSMADVEHVAALTATTDVHMSFLQNVAWFKRRMNMDDADWFVFLEFLQMATTPVGREHLRAAPAAIKRLNISSNISQERLHDILMKGSAIAG